MGVPLADYLAENNWPPYRMEADTNWWWDSPNGVEISGNGLSATLRDLARLRQFFLDGGTINGEAVLHKSWTETAGQPQNLGDGETMKYGYMCWPGCTGPSIVDGAIGVQGQNIYIKPTRNILIGTHMLQPMQQDRVPIDHLVLFVAITKVPKKQVLKAPACPQTRLARTVPRRKAAPS